MAKARRARVRPSRLVVPLVIAAVLLAGGVFAALKYGSAGTAAGPDVTPTVAATQSTAAVSPSPNTATPSSSSSKPAPSNDDDATEKASSKKLAACQAGVRAADAVMSAAKRGVGHWATHVQAQTDANSRKISIAKMDALFKETRLAGPADHRRYRDALAAYQDAKASCSSVKGADRKTAATLRRCEKRADAQRPVLAAAADGMQDWKSHLAAMQRSAGGHVANPQGVWIAAWKAAPPHINAFEKAVKDFDAPRC